MGGIFYLVFSSVSWRSSAVEPQLYWSCKGFSTAQTWSLLISHWCQPAGSDLMSQLMLNRGVAQIRSNSYEKWILNRVEHVDAPYPPLCLSGNRKRLFWIKNAGRSTKSDAEKWVVHIKTLWADESIDRFLRCVRRSFVQFWPPPNAFQMPHFIVIEWWHPRSGCALN